MAQRRTIRIRPPVRGLTDFPEHSTPEHSTQALNVEFYTGGVTTRGGTRRRQSNLYTQGGVAREVAVKLVKSFRLASGTDITCIGYVPRAGGEANSERFEIRDTTRGNLLFDFANGEQQLHAADGNLVDDTRRSRWDACLFQHLADTQALVVVCTDNRDEAQNSVYASSWQPANGLLGNVQGINRTGIPFHGGVLADSGYADDRGTYTTQFIRARFCRTHRGRLVLGNLGTMKFGGVQPPVASSLWYSNLGDVDGWRTESIVPPMANDASAITGLAEWQQHIVVFREGSIALFRLVGESPTPFPQYWQVVRDRGCIAHSTILDSVEGMTMFLGPDGFYGFNGSPTLVYLSESIERTLRQALGDMSFRGGAHAVHYPRHRQVWLAVPVGVDAPDRVFVMDYSYSPPAWSEFRFQGGQWSEAARNLRLGGFAVSGDGQRIAGVTQPAGGTMDYHQFDVPRAIDDQGGPADLGFLSRWESGPIGFGKGGVDRWRYLRFTIRPQGNYTHTAWWRRDGQTFNGGGNHNGQSVTASMAAQGGGNGLGAFVLGTDRLGAGEDHQIRLDVHAGGRGRYGRVGIETAASAADRRFDIRGAEIDVLDDQVRR